MKNIHQTANQDDMIILRRGEEETKSRVGGEIKRAVTIAAVSLQDTDRPPISWSFVVCCGQTRRGTKPWCRRCDVDHPPQRQP